MSNLRVVVREVLITAIVKEPIDMDKFLELQKLIDMVMLPFLETLPNIVKGFDDRLKIELISNAAYGGKSGT